MAALQVAGNAGVACPALRDTGPQGKDHHTAINTNRNGKEILIKGHALASSSWIRNFRPLHDLWLGAWVPWEEAQMTSGRPHCPWACLLSIGSRGWRGQGAQMRLHESTCRVSSRLSYLTPCAPSRCSLRPHHVSGCRAHLGVGFRHRADEGSNPEARSELAG